MAWTFSFYGEESVTEGQPGTGGWERQAAEVLPPGCVVEMSTEASALMETS